MSNERESAGPTPGILHWRKRKKKRDDQGRELEEWDDGEALRPEPEKYDPIRFAFGKGK